MLTRHKKRKTQQERDEQSNILMHVSSVSCSSFLSAPHSVPSPPLTSVHTGAIQVRPDISYQLVFTFLQLGELQQCVQCSHTWYNLIIHPVFFSLYHLSEYKPSFALLFSLIHSPFKAFITNVKVELHSTDAAIVPYISFFPLRRLSLSEYTHTLSSQVAASVITTVVRKLAHTLQHLTCWQPKEHSAPNTCTYELFKHISLLSNLKSLKLCCHPSTQLLPIHTLTQLQILKLTCTTIPTICEYEDKLQDILYVSSQLKQVHTIDLHLSMNVSDKSVLWIEMNDTMMEFIEAACNIDSLQQQLESFQCSPIGKYADDAARYQQYFRHLSSLPHLTQL